MLRLARTGAVVATAAGLLFASSQEPSLFKDRDVVTFDAAVNQLQFVADGGELDSAALGEVTGLIQATIKGPIAGISRLHRTWMVDRKRLKDELMSLREHPLFHRGAGFYRGGSSALVMLNTTAQDFACGHPQKNRGGHVEKVTERSDCVIEDGLLVKKLETIFEGTWTAHSDSDRMLFVEASPSKFNQAELGLSQWVDGVWYEFFHDKQISTDSCNEPNEVDPKPGYYSTCVDSLRNNESTQILRIRPKNADSGEPFKFRMTFTRPGIRATNAWYLLPDDFGEDRLLSGSAELRNIRPIDKASVSLFWVRIEGEKENRHAVFEYAAPKVAAEIVTFSDERTIKVSINKPLEKDSGVMLVYGLAN